jgi:L-lactate dehydrogenase complex protein LldG
MPAALADLASSLDRLDVGWTRTTTEAFSDALSAAIRLPAVGSPLLFDGISLPDEVTCDPTPAELDAATTGVTAAALGVAEYGSVVVRATPQGDEPVSLYPDRHVAVLRESDLVSGMDEAFAWFGETIRADRGSFVVATGPSATADMGALVRGAHGPSETHVVVLTDQ